MKDPKDISFVRVDILENWRFWNEYRNRLEDAGREVIEQADAMLSQDLTRNERAARLMSESIAFRKKKQEAGKAGGTAKATNSKNSDAEQAGGVADSNTITHTTAALPANHRPVVTSRIPDCKDMVIDFAVEHGIDVDDAVQMWEMTIERNGRTKDGKIITNWNGYLMSCCKTKTKKRSQQEG